MGANGVTEELAMKPRANAVSRWGTAAHFAAPNRSHGRMLLSVRLPISTFVISKKSPYMVPSFIADPGAATWLGNARPFLAAAVLPELAAEEAYTNRSRVNCHPDTYGSGRRGE